MKRETLLGGMLEVARRRYSYAILYGKNEKLHRRKPEGRNVAPHVILGKRNSIRNIALKISNFKFRISNSKWLNYAFNLSVSRGLATRHLASVLNSSISMFSQSSATSETVSGGAIPQKFLMASSFSLVLHVHAAQEGLVC